MPCKVRDPRPVDRPPRGHGPLGHALDLRRYPHIQAWAGVRLLLGGTRPFRTRSLPPVETVVQRSRLFGTAVANAGWAALVARHDGYAPVALLAAPVAPKDPVAQALGAAVGAQVRLQHR